MLPENDLIVAYLPFSSCRKLASPEYFMYRRKVPNYLSCMECI